MNKGNHVVMKSELMEQAITVKPYCSEGHFRFCSQSRISSSQMMQFHHNPKSGVV